MPAPTPPRSWAVEINMHTAPMDVWVSDSLRFVTHDDAESYGIDLSLRWRELRQFRLVPSDDPPNARFLAGGYVQKLTD